MSTLLWSIATFLLGILVFIATPVLIGPTLPRQWRERITSPYFAMAMTVMERALIVAKKGGGHGLYASSYDSQQMEEKIDFGGEPRWFDDFAGLMSVFKKKPLGVVDERYEVVWDPRIAEIAELRREQHDDGTVEYDYDGETHLTPHTEVPPETNLVDIRNASSFLGASFAPSTPDMVDSFIEKALEGYKSRDIVKDAVLIMAFLGGFGMVMVADYLGLLGGPVKAPGGDVVTGFSLWLGWLI